ncbi:MAG: glycosyltransferase family 2 protein [Gammaproteobacteria bacterium]|nr:glycosyltransferase family 2 protein [Gammaproteobacteria bacterium]
MKLNVVFTTYNSTEWLKKVLWGFNFQTYQDFEIIVADDGSTDETKQLIDEMRESTGMSIRHIWHEDNGFQKCRILNKALLNASCDYVVLTDGDCIPRKDFLEVHAEYAARGRYLSGSYYKLPMSTSETIDFDDVKSGRCFDVKWLQENGLPKSRKTLKINTSRKWAKLFNRLTPTKCNLKGSNASVWLDDVLAINGFDERMQWGGLDREFGVRLINHGIKPTHVRYDAVCVHLDHARGYKDPEMVKRNKQLRLDNAKYGVKWTDYGIQQLLDEGYQPETNYALQRLEQIKTNRPTE